MLVTTTTLLYYIVYYNVFVSIGRAAATPTVDVLSTLLWLGSCGWTKLLADRKHVFEQLRVQLCTLAEKYNERVLHTQTNHISLGTNTL